MSVRALIRTAILALPLAACASGGGAIRVSPPRGTTPASSFVQALYESGQDDEVVTRTTTRPVASDEVWFGAQSLLRTGRRTEASTQFQRLRDTADTDGFRRAAEVALARIENQPNAVEVARSAADTFPSDAFVLFEAGVTLAMLSDVGAAAQIFDAAIAVAPMFAHAYYQAGLAYSRGDRPDLTIARFETFVRLAPSAPERPQVDTILRAARGR